jgi:hypothetical protein
MSEPPDRIYIRGDVQPIDLFRAFRAWFERHAARQGQTLDPAWYRDGPEDLPDLYRKAPRQRTPGTPSDDGGDI